MIYTIHKHSKMGVLGRKKWLMEWSRVMETTRSSQLKARALRLKKIYFRLNRRCGFVSVASCRFYCAENIGWRSIHYDNNTMFIECKGEGLNILLYRWLVFRGIFIMRITYHKNIIGLASLASKLKQVGTRGQKYCWSISIQSI